MNSYIDVGRYPAPTYILTHTHTHNSLNSIMDSLRILSCDLFLGNKCQGSSHNSLQKPRYRSIGPESQCHPESVAIHHHWDLIERSYITQSEAMAGNAISLCWKDQGPSSARWPSRGLLERSQLAFWDTKPPSSV